jgi:DNA adenine methylase
MINKIERPVLRYHGGGAASVLMQKPRCYAEVYNDKWDTVVNVFNVLRDEIAAAELERVLRLTPFSRKEFQKCGEMDLINVIDPIEKARLTIFRSFAGFGSASTNNKYATGFRSNSNRSGTTPAHDWNNYPDHIQSFVERLKGVTIENSDYIKVIDQQDTKETLFYVDPPYVHSTRNMARGNAAYEHELTDADHIVLAEKLNQVKGMVVLSAYDCDLYNHLYGSWRRILKNTHADGARDRVEVLWLNKNCIQEINLFTL